jgi:hypothetical protein
MKQETNNEMDLLLRQLARRQDVFAPGAEDHLDVDELSAYAENVLPAKARARYTAHLAECSRCRDLVVQLSTSAGVVIAEQTEKVSGPSVWRKFLASLLSPMVLRYAAPALGLIVVAAIGLVVLRRERAADQVAQVQNEQAKPAGAAGFADPAQPQVHSPDSPSKTSGIVDKEVPAKNSPQLSPTPAPEGTPAAADQAARTAKAPEPKPESQPVVAAEPPAPATKVDSGSVSDEIRQQNKEAAKKQEAEVKVTAAEDSKKNFEVGRVAKMSEEPATARSRAAKRKSETDDSAGAATGTMAPASAPREESRRDDKDSSAETRTVAGRRFRKQGGIWIDTAYDSPRATMNINRSSEAYRSLIADEPAIKTIADQLDGEIIVVWKGRAYHIH